MNNMDADPKKESVLSVKYLSKEAGLFQIAMVEPRIYGFAKTTT
jgi:hypothetical protein